MMDLIRRVRRAATTPVDPADPDAVDTTLLRDLAGPVDALCRAWFRLDVQGLNNIPSGPALVVGNHNSGVSFVEALGTGARVYLHHGTSTPWHGLAHDAIIDMPGLGPLLTRLGALRAGHDTAAAAFARDRKVLVFPGGNREAFRPWRQRNEVHFYGRTGFVRLALRHRVPIVPVAYHGGHSAFIVLRSGRRIARYSGLGKAIRTDAWPLFIGLPWGIGLGPLFHVPLPVRCTTRFLEPIPTAHLPPDAANDPEVVAALRDEVQSRIQAALDDMAKRA